MSTDKKADSVKDTSRPGREEEVITNRDEANKATNGEAQITNLPAKDPTSTGSNETEGERRFKEGLANNNDTQDS